MSRSESAADLPRGREVLEGQVLDKGEARSQTSELPGWARLLADWLDDKIAIPGTDIRFGLDAVVGLIPGVGDAVTGATSVALLFLAIKEGVPTSKLIKMVANIGIDFFGGSIPVVGDLFDVAWRSNRKNFEVIDRHHKEQQGIVEKEKRRIVDYLILSAGVLLAIAAIVIPIYLLVTAGGWAYEALSR